MTTIDTLKDELAINDALGGAARTMLETARRWLAELQAQQPPPAEVESIEAELAEIEAVLDQVEQRQRDGRRLLGEA